MEIKIGKTYKVRSLEWIKKHCDKKHKGVYYFGKLRFSEIDERNMLENRLVTVICYNGISDYCDVRNKKVGIAYLPTKVLYTPVLDTIKKISEAINK